MYHAIRHPTAWQRVRAEVDAAAESSADPAVVSFVAAQKLPYLQACIKESMRVLPPSAIGLQRVAPPGGVTIGGRTFSAGTILSVHLPGVLLSYDIWGPDAREFRPERWLGPDAAALDRYFIPVRSLPSPACPRARIKADGRTLSPFSSVWATTHVLARISCG